MIESKNVFQTCTRKKTVSGYLLGGGDGGRSCTNPKSVFSRIFNVKKPIFRFVLGVESSHHCGGWGKGSVDTCKNGLVWFQFRYILSHGIDQLANSQFFGNMVLVLRNGEKLVPSVRRLYDHGDTFGVF